MTFVLDDFLKIRITIPDSIEEQRSVVECLATAQREVHVLEKLLGQYTAYRRALMHRLLSGEER
ncbi:MAG: restriction endonuclease subunit S [Gemmatimonadaceae bacterium]